MKKIVLAVAAASLMSLAACSKPAETQNVADAGDNAGAMLDNSTENLDAMADNATNATVANTTSNVTTVNDAINATDAKAANAM